MSVTDERLPGICDSSDVDRYFWLARDYVNRLVSVHDIKTAGKLPVFPKAHDQWFSRHARLLTILGWRAAARLSSARALQRYELPEFHDYSRAPQPHVVIKSISALGRAGLFAEALPDAKIVLLVRGPMGQIASRMTGILTGKLPPCRFDRRLLETPQAERLNATGKTIDHATPLEKMTWEWLITNQKAFDDLAGRPNACVVRYADMVADPIRGAQNLFAFADLPWHPACASFIQSSVSHRGRARYFQVLRDGSRGLNKWQTTLSHDDQSRIAAIVTQSSIGRRCLEALPA